MSDIRTNANRIIDLVDETIKSRNLSKSTRESYLEHIKKIVSLMASEPALKEFHPAARAYLLNMEKKGLSNSRLIQGRAAIRIGLEAISDAENEYKTWKLSRRKTARRIQKIVTPEIVASLFRVAETPLERAVLALAISTGMRRSEILNLKISDLNREKMEIHIREGKGCKDRLIPFPVELREELIRYYFIIHPEEYLFCDPVTKKKLTVSQLERMWKGLKERAGVTEVKGLHALRHYFATRLLETGVNIVVLQQLLGHSHVQTTMIYLHMTTHFCQVAKQAMGALLK